MGISNSKHCPPSMFDNTQVKNTKIPIVSNVVEKVEEMVGMDTITPDDIKKIDIEASKTSIPKIVIPSSSNPSNPSNPSNSTKTTVTEVAEVPKNTSLLPAGTGPVSREEPNMSEIEKANKEAIKMNGGFMNENIITTKDRYSKYNVFATIKEYDNKLQSGAGIDTLEATTVNPVADNKSMKHIKDIILEQLKELETNKQNGSGNCGCDTTMPSRSNKKGGSKRLVDDSSTTSSSSSYTSDNSGVPDSSSSTDSSSEYGVKSKSKNNKSKSKAKSKSKNRFIASDSSSFIVNKTESDNYKNYNNTSNGEESESGSDAGLSIFPFNSSDVKSSSSKNMKMFRRKI